MGQSNTIEEQQKQNAKFQAYVDQMRTDLDKSLTTQTAALNDKIKAHYSKYNDDASMISSSYQHLTTVSEWSLASVNVMIDSCRKAIFGGKLPDGAKKDTPTAEVTAAIQAMTNLDLLIANAAFDAIQGLLTSVGSKTETSITVKTDEKLLAPGMTLFITVMENSYHRKDFLSDESIVQTLFLFDVRFSIKEGKAVTKLNDLQAYENQKQSMRNQLLKVDNEVDKLDPSADNYLTMLAKFTSISDTLNTRLEAIDKKLQVISLLAGPAVNEAQPALAALPETLDGGAIVARIKARFDTALAARL
ncbi:hypothetical protein ASE98_17185 [Pseudomonas sp. Leaf48]|uniref:hypothetical protein n=1 Tax=Pseudomonas sp. Leaf48 TaxID=1736221 RepID=UPI00072B9D1E|nr:hypothetical protein [Pseudomonas sp. Leaf48]KQN54690.1 hypothetical protein ASE98_17185 [Pseudomonas sp. Leaf48]